MDQSEVAAEMVGIIPVLMRKIHGYMRCRNENMVSAHFRLLAILSKHPRTMTELAEMQGISPATLSNSVATLVEKGWVERIPSSGDRRVIEVEITSLGMERLHEMHDHLFDGIQKSLSNLPDEELQQLGAGIKILHRLLSEETGPDDCPQENVSNESPMKHGSRKR